MSSNELVELLYNAYNRDDSELLQLSKALDAQYDALYNTAKDVLQKKQEKLEEETKARIEKKKEYTEQALAMIKEQERVEQKKYEQAMLREQFNEKLKLDFKVN